VLLTIFIYPTAIISGQSSAQIYSFYNNSANCMPKFTLCTAPVNPAAYDKTADVTGIML